MACAEVAEARALMRRFVAAAGERGIAAVELTAGDRTLATAHGGVYELGIRERDHGVRPEPLVARSTKFWRH